MRKTITLSALAFVLATANASAQQLQYDRTGDHLMSYGPATGVSAPPVYVQKHVAHGRTEPIAQHIDRTADHMLWYGPVQ